MNEHSPKPSFGVIVRRDRLALAGIYMWGIAALILVVTPIVFRNMTLRGAMTFAAFPFTAGLLLIVPRVRLVGRLYERGVPLEAEVLTSEDYERRSQTGTLIRCRYKFKGKTYKKAVNTGEPIPGIRPGDRVTVLVDPEHPGRFVMTRALKSTSSLRCRQ